MEQSRLRAYFYPTLLRSELLIAVGAVLLLLLVVVFPGSARYDEMNRRVTAVFVDELGARQAFVEVVFVLSYLVVLFFVPLGLLARGALGMLAYRQGAVLTDAQADAILNQRLSLLPGELEQRLGLGERGPGDELLVLWAPRPEDREFLRPLDRKKRKKIKSAPGRVIFGKDKRLHCARLSVLALEKRGEMLYLLAGFYDLLERKMAGETWGVYALRHARKVKTDPDHGRLALVMEDGFQYVAHLLRGREAELLSVLTAFPLVRLEEAGEMLRQFCQIAAALPPVVPAPAAVGDQQPAPEPQRAEPAPEPDPAPEADPAPVPEAAEAGPPTPPGRRRMTPRERELLGLFHGDVEAMEGSIALEREQGHGRTRREWVEAAMERLLRDRR